MSWDKIWEHKIKEKLLPGHIETEVGINKTTGTGMIKLVDGSGHCRRLKVSPGKKQVETADKHERYERNAEGAE